MFRTADAFDQASRVTIAAFCARGTLLLGEPEVASVKALGELGKRSRFWRCSPALKLERPTPLQRPLLERLELGGFAPDAVRNPNQRPGLGVTAVASSGEPLIVGSRALMLQERVSVAGRRELYCRT